MADDPDLIERQRAVLDSLSEGQYEQFLHFRRSHFPLKTMRGVLEDLLNVHRSGVSNPVTEPMGIIAACLGKLFVGDIIERARNVMIEWGAEGAITPQAIREAHRRAVRDGIFDTGIGRGGKRRRLAAGENNCMLLQTSKEDRRVDCAISRHEYDELAAEDGARGGAAAAAAATTPAVPAAPAVPQGLKPDDALVLDLEDEPDEEAD